MSRDAELRKHLVELLQGGHAHVSFEDAVRGFPLNRIGRRPEHAPHSGWELLEHLRISQNDILEFSRSPSYVSPSWPEGYWPSSSAPQHQREWGRSVQAFLDDLAAFEQLLLDPERDLYRAFPWGQGQNLVREALVLADHNSYHLGQLIHVRKLLGAWQG